MYKRGFHLVPHVLNWPPNYLRPLGELAVTPTKAICAATVAFLLLNTSAFPATSGLKAVPNNFVPGRFDIVGEPSGYDPKSPHVFIHQPKVGKLHPVLLYIHGGRGLTIGSLAVTRYFQTLGFATVAFDAFKMNNISGLKSKEFDTKLSLTAKQTILTAIAEQAFDWILNQSWADTARIYIYGHSNGARVALAMAARVQKNNVPMIFAEAPAHCCIPLPGILNVPVKLIFGDKDNYAGKSEGDFLYERWSITNRTSTKQWAQAQLVTGKLEIIFYHGGHGLFLGEGVRSVRVSGTRWYLGGDVGRLKLDIKTWVTEPLSHSH